MEVVNISAKTLMVATYANATKDFPQMGMERPAQVNLKIRLMQKCCYGKNMNAGLLKESLCLKLKRMHLKVGLQLVVKMLGWDLAGSQLKGAE